MSGSGGGCGLEKSLDRLSADGWSCVRSCPAHSLLIFPFLPSSYWVVHESIYSFPVVRDSCPISAVVLQCLLHLKMYSWCIHRERYTPCPTTPLPSCLPPHPPPPPRQIPYYCCFTVIFSPLISVTNCLMLLVLLGRMYTYSELLYLLGLVT